MEKPKKREWGRRCYGQMNKTAGGYVGNGGGLMGEWEEG